MTIPITIGSSSEYSPLPSGLARISHNEVVLVELQGALEVESREARERDGRLIGRFGIDENGTRATLFIGHHLLEGKVAQMPKPFAVMHRKSAPAPRRSALVDEDRGDDAMDLDAPADDASAQENVSWEIIAVVKRKIVFSKRPMPIVGRTAQKTGGR
ncbi:Ctf8-domain-containing protein [Schizophyllum commune]